MINTVSQINKALEFNATDFVVSTENEYHNQIKKIADSVVENRSIGVIMLAGPSGSGKTTTAHILRDCLRDAGLHTEVVSLDNFYLESSDPRMPLLPNGRPDFESVYSLDIHEIRRCIKSITEDKECDIPIFDFVSRSRKDSRIHLDIGDGIVIIEGLHALNPLLLEGANKQNVLKIYISVNTPVLNDDGSVLLTSRQIRLIRRSLRDNLYRGSDIYHTLKLWTSVVEGEAKYLYAHKDSADIKITTLHPYELAVFRDTFLKMTENLDASIENYDYVMRTREGIKGFVSVSENIVPWDSLIREFIPGGKYEGT